MDTPTKKISIKAPDDPRPLLTHLAEFRNRLLYIVGGLVVASAVSYPAVTPLIEELARPVGKLYFIGPVEAFMARLKIMLFLGVLVSLPFSLFQIWSFVQKGLLVREKRFILAVTLVSSALFLAGAAFCYFFILPVGIKFLLAYGSEVLVPMITISRYLSFVTTLVLAFGLIFELPVVLGFMTMIGVVSSAGLRHQRRIAVVIIFIAAAALTPGPDVFSQFMMAVPLVVLYEVSIIVAQFIEGRKKAGMP